MSLCILRRGSCSCLRARYSWVRPVKSLVAEPAKKRGRKRAGDAGQAAAEASAAHAAGPNGKSPGAAAGEKDEELVLWRVNYDEFNRRRVPGPYAGARSHSLQAWLACASRWLDACAPPATANTGAMTLLMSVLCGRAQVPQRHHREHRQAQVRPGGGPSCARPNAGQCAI